MPIMKGRDSGLAFSCGGAMITKEMTIGEIISLYPATLPVFGRYGLDCSECQIAEFEELEHGAGVHKVDITLLLDELNRVAGKP
jgi:hybrid cluster-associated redox disulfide protein